jgi:hypothetical protein
LSRFSEMPKSAKIIVSLAVAVPVLLGTGWAANYLQSSKAGNRTTGQIYQGTIKYVMNAQMRRDRFRENDRIAVVQTDEKHEIFVHDLGGRFDGCESEDLIDYRMEESAVKGFEFVYIQASCREP